MGRMTGAEIHLNAINAALHRDFIREPGTITRISLSLLAAIIAVGVSLCIRSPWFRIVALFGFSLGGIGVCLFCFNYLGVYFPMVAPLTQLTATMLLGVVCDFTSERVEKVRLRRVFERYVSRDIVREVVDSPALHAQSLGGVVKPVAILFSDIRSYSAVTAQSSPSTLVAQLNEYFTGMVDCVFQYGGTLDKFIGDALMAVWG